MARPRSALAVNASVESPSTPDGAALSIIALRAASPIDMQSALDDLSLSPLDVGSVRLLDLLGVDQGLAIRWSPTLTHLTPHGGVLVTRRLLEELCRFGVHEALPDADPRTAFPEAASLIEACALETLAQAASPRAIDVVLRHCALWSAARSDASIASPQNQTALNRLLSPPLAVLLGPPNIGKSTLTNALAGRHVSIVADEPGVTRDHVGVSLELDGLAVCLLDAPGISAEPSPAAIDAAARRMAIEAAKRADLLILCADRSEPFPDPSALGLSPSVPTLRLGLRADLGSTPHAELEVSALANLGIDTAARAARRLLLPDSALETTDLWRFHSALPSPPRSPGSG